jgi:hypothetical protein
MMPDLVNQQQPLQNPAVPVEVPRAENEGVEDPNVALPAGLRALHLSEEVAAILKQLLDDPKQPTHAGQEMPTADASALLKNNRP